MQSNPRSSLAGYSPRIYDWRGRRLWMTGEEMRAFLNAAESAPAPWRTLLQVLAFTGCNPAEALALRPAHIDLASRSVHFETLRRRTGKASVRSVPLPGFVLADLDSVHAVDSAQSASDRGLTAPLLWPWSDVTAWNRINRVIEIAGIEPGPHATARGLRHGFATLALAHDIPLDVLQNWLGHARIYATRRAYDPDGKRPLATQQYTAAEQREFAARIWNTLGSPVPER
jgi:integrase/recombinase XerD